MREVVEHAKELDGQQVVVSGWLESCQPLSCGLFDSAEEVESDFPYYLGIGSSEWFDSFADGAAPAWIVLRARVNDECISNPATQEIALCTDRSGSLEPLALIQ